MHFTKPALTTEDHYALLLQRGLIIEDKNFFLKTIDQIGYYRLSGYMYPFQSASGDHQFKANTYFDQILKTYLFDEQLRLIIFEEIGRIEVSFRSKISNIMALQYGVHWYLDPVFFNKLSFHNSVIEHVTNYCEETSEPFILNYKSKYTHPALPPSWMTFEILTFGSLVNIYLNLRDEIKAKDEISGYYNLPKPVFESWLKSLHYLRNCVAHHSRTWNKRIPLKPIIPMRRKFKMLQFTDEETNRRLYGILSCMLYLQAALSDPSLFKQKLKHLFEDFPDINLSYMGFPDSWKEEVLWQ